LKVKAQPKRALKTTSGAVGTTSNGEILTNRKSVSAKKNKGVKSAVAKKGSIAERINQKSNPKIPALLDDTRPAILGRVAVTTTAKDSRAY
jgi:hypothetical protein